MLRNLKQLCMLRGSVLDLVRPRHLSGGSEFFTGSGRVTLDRDEDSGIAVITLDNPGKKNALSGGQRFLGIRIDCHSLEMLSTRLNMEDHTDKKLVILDS